MREALRGVFGTGLRGRMGAEEMNHVASLHAWITDRCGPRKAFDLAKVNLATHSFFRIHGEYYGPIPRDEFPEPLRRYLAERRNPGKSQSEVAE